MICRIALAALLLMAAGEKHSGYQDASPETRAMQDDDASNPGFLWVQQGETLWNERTGSAGRSCADCHGAAPVAMGGVASPRTPDVRSSCTIAQRWLSRLVEKRPACWERRSEQRGYSGRDSRTARRHRHHSPKVTPRTRPALASWLVALNFL